ncbi:MAG: hypothetical protein H0T76_01245 [Nannocystis sp.]|nr:hypothetical protein [Nannocystis sp.]MBA3545087.1 hypothetical protein [Nannocystis sp.]
MTGADDPAVHDAYTEAGATYGASGSLPSSASPASRRRVKIPDLYCPFDPAVHPAAADVHMQSVAWARAMGLARDDQHVQALHRSRVGWLVGRAFPVADRLPALQIAADWTTLFCLIDNHIENIRGPALSHVYLRGLLGVFRDGAAPLIVDPFAQAFRDLRERMLEVDVPTWIERFGEQLERLFRAFVDEAKYRVLAAVPELVKYKKMREVSVGLYFGFRLGELTDGINLPTSVREHATVRDLESKASYIVGLANDIYTVEKEMAKGEVNNMVLVLMHEENLGFEDAMRRAVELHDAETREFAEIAASLPSFTLELDLQLHRYVEVLTSLVCGHNSWADETDRYAPRSQS